jgi:hypothetical protein
LFFIFLRQFLGFCVSLFGFILSINTEQILLWALKNEIKKLKILGQWLLHQIYAEVFSSLDFLKEIFG